MNTLLTELEVSTVKALLCGEKMYQKEGHLPSRFN